LSHPYTTKEVDELFIKEIVRLHGFPASIVSDKDRLFMSLFWKELFKTAGTQLKLSSAYHPQTDGQTEVANKSLEVYLGCLIGTKNSGLTIWPRLNYGLIPTSIAQQKCLLSKLCMGKTPLY